MTASPDPLRAARMLRSIEGDRWAYVDSAKVRSGRFLTTGTSWLQPQVRAWIAGSGCSVAVDPFAGEGHLLRAVRDAGLVGRVRGLDIAPNDTLGIEANDSLVAVPRVDGGIIVTNPPWLARHSARRKRVWEEVAPWFAPDPQRRDLSQVALDRCLATHDHVVAILPETFLLSGYPMGRARSLTVLRQAPFSDTTAPTLVACFGPGDVPVTAVYEDDVLLGDLEPLLALRPSPSGDVPMTFNDPSGRLALRAVDNVAPGSPVAFMPASQLAYDPAGIKPSSRLVTRIGLGPAATDIDGVSSRANAHLKAWREASADIGLAPFKGNVRDGRRRRRLDYLAARAIIERAVRGEWPS